VPSIPLRDAVELAAILVQDPSEADPVGSACGRLGPGTRKDDVIGAAVAQLRDRGLTPVVPELKEGPSFAIQPRSNDLEWVLVQRGQIVQSDVARWWQPDFWPRDDVLTQTHI